MKFKEILSLVYGLNGELCRREDYLTLERLGDVGSRNVDERVVGWCNLVEKYGDHEIRDILPLDYCRLRVTIK